MKPGMMKRSIVLGILCLLVGVSFIGCIDECCSVKTKVENVENIFLSDEKPSPITYSNNDPLFTPEINRIVSSENIPSETKWNTTLGKIDYDFGRLLSNIDLTYVAVEGLQQPAIDIVKEVSNDSGVTWSDTATVYLGDEVYFRLTVINTGKYDFSIVRVIDVFPAEYITFASQLYIVNTSSGIGLPEWIIWSGLPVGGSIQIIFAAHMSFYVGTFGNYAYALGYVAPYPDPIGDYDMVSVTILPPAIDIVKEVSNDSGVTWSDTATVYSGDVVYFRLTVINTGNSDFSYVRVMDIFPVAYIIFASMPYIVNASSGIGLPEWFFCLPVGGSIQIIFAAHMSFGVGTFGNYAYALGYVAGWPYTDPPVLDMDAVSVTIRPPPMPIINVLKEVSSDGITYSDSSVTVYKTRPVYFRLTVTNTGNTDLSDVVVSDTLPGFLSYNADANPPPDSISGLVIDWDLGTLTEWDMLVITFTANASAVGDGDNTADASGLFRTTLVSDVDIAHVIVENIPPVANFSYNPLNPTDLDTIQFNDTSYDLAGSIVNWTWSFGDGNISYQQHPTHQYSDHSTYTVKLKVTDDDNAYDELSKQLVVLNAPPVADAGGPYQGTLDSPVIYFDGSGSCDLDGTIVSYEWDFGDGSPLNSECNPIHRYDDVGRYNVKLTVEDDDGDTDSQMTFVVISHDPPTVTLIYPTGGETLKDTVTIRWSAYDSKDGDNLPIYLYYSDDDIWYQINDVLENTGEYSWDTSKVPDGTYRLLVIAFDSDDDSSFDSSESFDINNIEEANNPPNKPSKPSGPTSGKAGSEYTYTSSTTDPDGDQIWYMWNWGDETGGWLGPYTSGAVCEASHTWNAQGDYNVKVKAKDQYGEESPWSEPLSISMPKTKPYSDRPFLRFLQNFLQNHPLIYQLLQRFLRL